jgi:4-carboxymuconolactone decarboxylase
VQWARRQPAGGNHGTSPLISLKRDRSLVVCAVLTATYRPEQLKGHLQRALDNGLTKTELSEMITHVAFYAGWPAAMSAANIAREVFEANP